VPGRVGLTQAGPSATNTTNVTPGGTPGHKVHWLLGSLDIWMLELVLGRVRLKPSDGPLCSHVSQLYGCQQDWQSRKRAHSVVLIWRCWYRHGERWS
jgi:hypothetical protein